LAEGGPILQGFSWRPPAEVLNLHARASGPRFCARSSGEVREWLNRLAWKVSYRQKRYVGSNPTLSASVAIVRGLCWRGARVVESAGLENRNTLRGIEGSNPSLSATQNGSARKMCWTYVLWSEKLQKRYVGSTIRTPEERVREHNDKRTRFTSGGVPWILVHAEWYATLSGARNRERYLKTGVGRKWLDENVRVNSDM
jgi:putative endonuclease